LLASDRTLVGLKLAGALVVEPSEPELLQPASVDLRLDRWFQVFQNHRYDCIDPRLEQGELTELVETADDQPFVLHPGEFVLGSTLETITLDESIAGRIEGKSSLGRLGLLTHSTAGFIDPGFSGHITLELSNVANLPIKLWPGMKIGQLCVFQLTTPSSAPYGSSAYGSRYQGQRGPTASRAHLNFRTWPTRTEEPTQA
jgi:dCTP deaminase